MLEQNINFQEKYKSLDNLCKDCYNSQEGVSEYIRQMDKYMLEGKRLVKDWENEYSNLKHVRWIRNQLAHEVGTLNSDIVEENDILFLSNFYNKIINANDALSVLRKIKSEQIKSKHTKVNVNATREKSVQPTKKEAGFLSKLLNKIKNFLK